MPARADQIREYLVRVTDIDLLDHMNNAVYWNVTEDYLSSRPELLGSPLRVTLEHEAPIALGDKLEILAHTHPAGSTDKFGAELAGRAVTTPTYVAGD
jgi:acyl-ACP thioesterase